LGIQSYNTAVNSQKEVKYWEMIFLSGNSFKNILAKGRNATGSGVVAAGSG